MMMTRVERVAESDGANSVPRAARGDGLTGTRLDTESSSDTVVMIQRRLLLLLGLGLPNLSAVSGSTGGRLSLLALPRSRACCRDDLIIARTRWAVQVQQPLKTSDASARLDAGRARSVHFEPPVVLRGGVGQPQAHSTNTMGLFNLGGENALFQEYTVDYFPYQNRTALLFSSDAGRTWAQPAGGNGSISCMNVAHPGRGCSQAIASPGCECTWNVNPITIAHAGQRQGVAGYMMPLDISPSSAIPGLVDYNTSTTSAFTATPSGKFTLNQRAGQPLRFIGIPRAWDGTKVMLNPGSACDTIALPDGSQLMCALVGSGGCWGASTSASCKALNRTGLSTAGCADQLACPGPTLVALRSTDGGKVWQFRGIIYQARSIFVETNLAVLSDNKTVIAVFRCGQSS
jgi:hypothetical protein